MKIWRKQIRIYLQVSIEPKHGAFGLNNKVSMYRSVENVCLKNVWVKIVLESTFWKTWRKQFKIYPSTSIEPKYCAFYLNKKISVHGPIKPYVPNLRAVWLFCPGNNKLTKF